MKPPLKHDPLTGNRITPAQSEADVKAWDQAWQIYEATGKVLQALKPLTQNERRRILNYFMDRIQNP